ncbi:MAG: TVP38/TMEM64 family protein [Candidatus Abyssobacteria bacterium SURF_5]|uniref:TVP38/TMEM64 family membrane protein n=1 Tax=Abyssobacteria bacterium (strain SURF_5) TaxID=2093360 RepID=A0A3A4NNC4_ABYX5|nr:MAG: TVP38/TMEM64 family protein [Candidatus Abyssubacteria bacterium SURF_5]
MNEIDKPKPKKDLWKPIFLLVLILMMLALARVFGLGEKLALLREWIRSLGAWGPAAFVLIYVAAVVAAVPGSALTVTAGALFGSVVGVVVVIFGATIGASLAFLISRYFARDAVARWLSTKEKFRRIDQLTERHGAIIVALTRLAPIFPFNLLNYGFGLTRVRFRTYVFWSFLCMLPGTVLYVVGADVFARAVSQGRVPWILVAILAAAAIGIVFLVRAARRKLREKEANTGNQE